MRARSVAGRTPSSAAGWGATFREVLVHPSAGVDRALRKGRALRNSGPRRAVALTTALAGVAGSSLMLLWLKAGVVFGFADTPPSEFSWGVFAAALVAGAVVGVLAHFAFGVVGSKVTALFRRRSPRSDLRMAWGVAAFPLIVGLFVLLVLDLSIAGSTAFTQADVDAFTTAWAATSTAIGISLLLLSGYLFALGVRLVADATRGQTAVLAATALFSLAGAAIVSVLALIGGELVANVIGDLAGSASE